MKSKILIDVDEQGLPTILIDNGELTLDAPNTISQLHSKGFLSIKGISDIDVRDKLIKRFLEGGCCALITVNDDQSRSIISMTPIDMLQNIADMFKSQFVHKPSDDKKGKEFEQYLLSAASMLESLGYRSNAFNKAIEKQN